MRIIILVILICSAIALFANDSFASKVRRVPVKGDQIVTVRTALGIATIIQVPDKPNSVVVGDQELFKVEYLDQAITIKPLSRGAKTNLYIYTDWKRYNVELVSVGENEADYVVYLENPVKEQSSVNWISFHREATNEGITFRTIRMAKVQGDLLLLEFELSSSKKETLSPEWFWLTQNGKTKPIHNLMLSALELNPKEKVQGVVQILMNDLNPSENFRFELRRKKTSSLLIRKVEAWK